jgi:hypothetical protein
MAKPLFEFVWTDDNIEHLADNGLEPDDAEAAVSNPDSAFRSKSSRRKGVRGSALDDGVACNAVYDLRNL